MHFTDIAAVRLHNQHLLAKLDDPLAVVRSYGAMQAQEFRPAKWAVGMRSGSSEAVMQQLFDSGQLLRTHMLRPTWHFVLPEDIVWIQALTAPRVQAFSKYYYKKMELDEATLQKSVQVLAKAVQDGPLLRSEVKAAYQQAGIATAELRLGLLLMYAELQAVVCSGPMRGKQHTYMLVAHRAPQAKRLSRQEALAELTRRFFTAHGPATASDFAWWSSLTVAEIKEGIALAKLQSMQIEGTAFYYGATPQLKTPSPSVHLLPIYDELTVAYKERRPISQLLAGNTNYNPKSLFYNLLAIDGQVAGGWKWGFNKIGCTLQITPLITLNGTQKASLAKKIEQLEHFLGLPVTS